MSGVYEVTLRKEVLREFASSLDARYSRYMRKHGIKWENKKDPISAADHDIVAAMEEILFCNTLDELMVFEMRLKELRNKIESLEEDDKCGMKGWRGTLKPNSVKYSSKNSKSSRKISIL